MDNLFRNDCEKAMWSLENIPTGLRFLIIDGEVVIFREKTLLVTGDYESRYFTINLDKKGQAKNVTVFHDTKSVKDIVTDLFEQDIVSEWLVI